MVQRPEFTPRNLQGADRPDEDGQAERCQCRKVYAEIPPSVPCPSLPSLFYCNTSCVFFVLLLSTHLPPPSLRIPFLNTFLFYFAARLTTMVMISLHDDFFGHAFQKSIRDCPATAANSFSLLGEHLFVHLGRPFCPTLIWFFGPSLAECLLSFPPVTSSILVFDFTFFIYINPSMHLTCITLGGACVAATLYTLSTLIPRSSRKSTILSTCHRTAYRESKRVEIPGCL